MLISLAGGTGIEPEIKTCLFHYANFFIMLTFSFPLSVSVYAMDLFFSASLSDFKDGHI